MKSMIFSDITSSSGQYSLAIESLEGGIYIALIAKDEPLAIPLTNSDGQWIKTRSLNEMQSLLGAYHWKSVTLVQQSTHDEMIGTPTSHEKLKIPLNWQAAMQH